MQLSSALFALALTALPLGVHAEPLHEVALTPKSADWAPAKERYEAVVLQNPNERQQITGFFKLSVSIFAAPTAIATSFPPPHPNSCAICATRRR